MKFFSVILLIGAKILLSQAQGIDWPTCDPNVVTWHPHPYACTRYVLCFHGNPIERLCAPGLHFSAEFEHCTFPQLALCDINYACPEVDDVYNPVFLPDGDDCSAYFVCFEGRPIHRECASNLWWDVVFNWCNIAEEVTCDSRVPNNPREPTPPPPTTEVQPTHEPTDEPTTIEPTTIPPTTIPPTTIPPTTIPPTTIPPTTIPPTTIPPTTTTQNPNTYDCPLSSDPTFHPHSLDCQKYFVCINGIAFLRECAPGLIFDIVSRACDEKEFATCISGAVEGPDSKLPVETIPDKFKCPLSSETLFYPHRHNCHRYYICEVGIAYLRSCPSGQSYDVNLQNCVIDADAVCLKDL